jgi:hypothetical protein
MSFLIYQYISHDPLLGCVSISSLIPGYIVTFLWKLWGRELYGMQWYSGGVLASWSRARRFDAFSPLSIGCPHSGGRLFCFCLTWEFDFTHINDQHAKALIWYVDRWYECSKTPKVRLPLECGQPIDTGVFTAMTIPHPTHGVNV